MTVATAPQRAPVAPRRARTPLTVVAPAPYRAPLAPFILLSVVLVVVGLIALLLLNTLVNEDSFQVGSLEAQTTALNERAQVLATELARLQAPSTLATRAKARGLVPAATPAFVRLADGRIIGTPGRAVAPPPPAPPAPPPTATATAPKQVPDGVLVEVTDAGTGAGKTPATTRTTKPSTTRVKPPAARSGVLQEVTTTPTKQSGTPAGKPVLELVTTPAGTK